MTAMPDIRDESYKALCEEWKEVNQLLKEAKAKEAELRAALIEAAGGDRMEYGVQIKQVTSKGTIQWKDIPEVRILDEKYLDQYRGEAKNAWYIKPY